VSLTISERIEQSEKLLRKLHDELQEVATFEEREAVVNKVFDKIKELQDQIVAIRNNMEMVERTITTAKRKN